MATYYNGYKLSADSSITSQQLSSAFSTITDSLAEIITAADEKYTELETFAAEEPSVDVSAMSIDLAEVSSTVDEVITDVVSKIMGIINSIVDYGDGKWDNENNKLFLDGFMSSNGLGYNPGGGPKDPVLPSVEPTVENPSIDADLDVEVPVSAPEVVESDYISENTGDYSYSNMSYEVPFVPQSYNNEEDELQSSFVSPSDIGTSFSDTFFDSATNFAVPTISSKKVAGVKSSGVVGIAGIAAAAALAVGGKIYYDKQHNEDEIFEEDGEVSEEDISTQFEETGTDLVEEAISNLNVVRFKEGILNMGEGDA